MSTTEAQTKARGGIVIKPYYDQEEKYCEIAVERLRQEVLPL
jgi:hypothetical protein